MSMTDESKNGWELGTEETGKDQMVIQKTAAVEKKEEAKKAEALAAKIASYRKGDLKSFCALADESISNKHKTFSKYPDLLDDFVKTRREQQLQYTHGTVATIFRFFLSIFSFFFGGKSLNIMPKPLPERENGFVFKTDPGRAKLLKTQEEIEYEVDGHKIELSKKHISESKEDGTLIFSQMVVDGVQYKFTDLQKELSKRYGPEKSAEITTSIADFTMLSITPEHERSAKAGVVMKQHEGLLKGMEKSPSDLASDVILARSQAAQKETPAPRRSGITLTAEEGQEFVKKVDKIHEDSKTYRPVAAAARSRNDDDNTMAPGR